MGIIFKACVLAQEGQSYCAYRPVTLFADDDLGNTLVRTIFVIHLIAIDEYDDVRILFDGARLAQILHHRPFIGTLFETAIELG